MKKIPNLFIVGAPRTGTTALHSFLSQHSEIFMSDPKEPNFFCSDIHLESDNFHKKKKFFRYRNVKEYISIFDQVKNEKIIGESSTTYLKSTIAAKNIFKYNPEAKIIIIIRNPVDFLFSLYNRMQYMGVEENIEFEDALNLEKLRKNGVLPKSVIYPSSLYYHERVKFKEQIKRYKKYFNSQIKIIIFEEFKNDNQKIFLEILDFLGVNSDFKPIFKIINKNKVITNTKIHFLLTRIVRNSFTIKLSKFFPFLRKCPKLFKSLDLDKSKSPKLDFKLRRKLMKKYYKDVKELESFLNINLVKIWGYE
jgi:hypothetical protein